MEPTARHCELGPHGDGKHGFVGGSCNIGSTYVLRK